MFIYAFEVSRFLSLFSLLLSLPSSTLISSLRYKVYVGRFKVYVGDVWQTNKNHYDFSSLSTLTDHR